MKKKPWNERPDIVKKYCTCEFVHISYKENWEESITMEADGGLWALSKINPDCKLHGENKMEVPF